MTNKLGDSIKSLVIQQWLQGLSRDTIAANNGISAGAVTNTVNEWRQALGSTTGTELRELGVTLKKVGINPAQCATGFRAAIAMAKLGVKEEDFESFISDVYDRCRDQGITPENTASYLKDLLEFSKTVPFSKMSGYILQKTDEKGKLEAKINELIDQKWKLIGDISNLETRHLVALDDQKITEDSLKWYTDLKAELGKNGMPVDDISHLVKVVNGIEQHGFSAEQVLKEFSNLESLKVQYQGYRGSIIRLKSQYDTLNRDYSFLQQMVSSHNKSLSIYSELEAMGFGLKELTSLWYTVREIAGANNIPLDEAVEKFLKDVEEQYDNKLGLESKAHKLRVEVSRLKQQETNSRVALFLHPLVGSTVLGLFQSGVSEQDILTISELFKADSRIGINIEER